MLKHRLQILLTPEQLRLLKSEARARRKSVGALVREAIEAHLGGTIGSTERQRLQALAAIKAMSGRYLPPGELDRIAQGEREADLPA
jgi:hypothetical protein